MDEIDHEYTDCPVCPVCGFWHNDWWDGLGFDGDGAEIIMHCHSCDAQFKANMIVKTEFVTETVGKEQG